MMPALVLSQSSARRRGMGGGWCVCVCVCVCAECNAALVSSARIKRTVVERKGSTVNHFFFFFLFIFRWACTFVC